MTRSGSSSPTAAGWRLHFALGLPAIVVGHAVLNSAYSTLIIQARMVGLDPALEEAAADLGATPWRTFRRVTLITLMPAIIAAGLLAFTFSLDDVVTSYFCRERRSRRCRSSSWG